MKILKENKLIIECSYCKSVFEIDSEDITAVAGLRLISCPVCKKSIDLNKTNLKDNETN